MQIRRFGICLAFWYPALSTRPCRTAGGRSPLLSWRCGYTYDDLCLVTCPLLYMPPFGVGRVGEGVGYWAHLNTITEQTFLESELINT